MTCQSSDSLFHLTNYYTDLFQTARRESYLSNKKHKLGQQVLREISAATCTDEDVKSHDGSQQQQVQTEVAEVTRDHNNNRYRPRQQKLRGITTTTGTDRDCRQLSTICLMEQVKWIEVRAKLVLLNVLPLRVSQLVFHPNVTFAADGKGEAKNNKSATQLQSSDKMFAGNAQNFVGGRS